MAAINHYLILIGMIICTAGFIGFFYLANRLTGKSLHEPGKMLPAESGNLAKNPAWSRYHVHFYVIALLFLAFDMEMAYMYPWAVVYKELGLMALLDMGVFLMILFLGLIYTWNQGGLKRQ